MGDSAFLNRGWGSMTAFDGHRKEQCAAPTLIPILAQQTVANWALDRFSEV
jgi:hypothetical protein